MQIADHPSSTPPFDERPGGNARQESYLLSSPLGALIARLLHLHDHFLLFGFVHLIVLLLVLFFMTRATERRYGPEAANLAVVLFAAAPISTVTFTWLGQPDVFTIGFVSAIALARSNVIVFLASLGLGFNTFEQGMFLVLVLLALRQAFTTVERWPVWLPFVGVGLGKLVLEGYHSLFTIVQVADRTRLLADIGIGRIAEGILVHWPVLIVSLYWVAWLFIGRLHGALAQWGETRAVRYLLAAQALALAGMAVAFDYTRVHAVLSWPILLVAGCWAASQLRDELPTLLLRLSTLALAPAILVWGFGLYSTAYPAMYKWLQLKI